MACDCGRCCCNPLRRHFGALDFEAACRQCPHARNRRGHSGRRPRLSEPPVLHHRDCRRHSVLGDWFGARLGDGRRLCGRRDPVRIGGLHRHVHLGTRQRAHRAGRAQRHQCGAEGGVPRRRHHRHVGRGLRVARRRRLLLRHAQHAGRFRYGIALAGGPGLRRFPHFDFRALGRRHFHQGRRCRRGPGGQGRGRYSRG